MQLPIHSVRTYIRLSSLNSSLTWELINTISHTTAEHTEILSKNLSDYKEVKIVCIGSTNFMVSNVFDTSFLSDTEITLIVGGGQANSAYGIHVFLYAKNNKFRFPINAITENGAGISGIFYIYVR